MKVSLLQRIFFVLLFSFSMSGDLLAENVDKKRKIIDFTEAWLELLDKKNYQKAWQLMTIKTKKQVSFTSWVGIVEYNRNKLGNYKHRELNVFHKDKDVELNAVGSEVFLFYSSAFEKYLVKENICVISDLNGNLLIDSYVVLR